MTTQPPLVVIVGGGFGELAAAKEMKCSCVNVLLIDRSNHHVFSASSLSGCYVSSGARPDSVADSQPPCKTGKYVRDAGQCDRS